MKYKKSYILLLCLMIMSGCYPKVDPSLIYIGEQDASPDTLTEAGRAINEGIANKMKARLDSSFIDYKIASHPVVYPKYYAGFYLNGYVKPVFIGIGDTATVRKELCNRIGNNNFILKQGEYSSTELDSTLKIINEKKTNQSLKILLVRKDTRKNRIIVSLEKCSPRNIYRFHHHITNSRAVIFEEVTHVVLL